MTKGLLLCRESDNSFISSCKYLEISNLMSDIWFENSERKKNFKLEFFLSPSKSFKI